MESDLKIFFSLFLVMMCGLMIYCFVLSVKKKTEMTKPLCRFIAMSIFCSIFYIMFLFTRHDMLARLYYGLYLSFMSWSILCFLWYAVTLTDIKIKCGKIISFTLCTVAFADTISLILNTWLCHAVTFTDITIEGELYRELLTTIYYDYHIVICYIFALITCLVLILEIVKSPKVYRVQYFTALLIFLVFVGANAVFIYAKLIVDISLAVYGIAASFLTYYTFEYVKRSIVREISEKAIFAMKDTIIAFDKRGNLLFSNIDGTNKGRYISTANKLDLFCAENKVCEENELMDSFTKEIAVGNGEITFECNYYSIKDAGNKEIGCYFQFDDITDSVNRYKRQKYLAEHDDLTGIKNKRAFCKESLNLLIDAREDYYIICANIRGFKLINEKYGTSKGDEVLKTVANVITNDIGNVAVACRMESDHYAMLVTRENFDKELFREKSTITMEWEDGNREIQICYGVYHLSNGESDVSAICERALMAVDTMSDDYHDCFAYYDDKMKKKAILERRIREQLPEAMEKKQVCIYLQPQVDSTTEMLTGAEALVRWMDPEFGVISPGQFVPLLEECGMITRLDMYIWEEVCSMLVDWNQKGYNVIPVSINVSGYDIDHIDVYKYFTGLVDKYNINKEQLRIEITESSFATHSRQLDAVSRLRESGFVVEMDDFGSGYSSLNMLRDIPMDIIKIDMAFMYNCIESSKGMTILKSVIALACEMGIPTLAEGVETKEQAELLRDMGCKYIQGYYYSKPISVDEYVVLMNANKKLK